MTVAVVTDSAASLPVDLVASLGVVVLPMTLTIGDVLYDDGELPLQEVLAHPHADITTSGPPVGSFEQCYEALLDEHEAVVVVTIASTMSSTFGAANLAASMAGGRIAVLDSTTAAGAEGLVVVAAATAAQAGADLDRVVEAAREAQENVRLVATLDSIDRLVASGRVPQIAGWAGGRLGVNPLFEFRDGEVRRLRPAFSRQAALDRIMRTLRATVDPARPRELHAAVLHALAPDDAAALEAAVRDLEPDSLFNAEFSAVMVSHTGPGLIGLAWRWGRPAA